MPRARVAIAVLMCWTDFYGAYSQPGLPGEVADCLAHLKRARAVG